jgi:uncharacterized protein (DUF983 family)
MVEGQGRRGLPPGQGITQHEDGESGGVFVSSICESPVQQHMGNTTPHRGYFMTLLTCRCPRCREGKLFVYPLTFRLNRNTDMHAQCPACSQITDIEVGFYYGTGYISYLVALLISGISFLLWFLLIGFSFEDRRFMFWVIFNSLTLVALQPWLMRFSRVLWLSFFVSYDPEWRNHRPDDPERIIKEHMNNW